MNKIIYAIPHHADAHQYLAKYYMNNGDLALAHKELQNVLKLGQSNAETHNLLSFIYYYQNFINKAEAEAKEAIRLNPNVSQGYVNLAFVYYKQGKPQLSFLEAQKSIAIDRFAPEGYLISGIYFKDKNEIINSIREFNIYLELTKNFYGYYDNYYRNLADQYLDDLTTHLELF